MKLVSLVDLIDNMDIHAAVITETWMKTNRHYDRIKEYITMDRGLDLLSYNRPGRRNGGGVAIVFDPKKLKLTENKFRRDGLEIVSAKGKIIGDTS